MRAIAKMGFKQVGKNVLLSEKSSYYNTSNIVILDNSRIDDFCIISAGVGGILIGRNVHIACYCSLIGSATITLDDFAGISSKTAIYSSNDDYSGEYLTGPTVPMQFRNVNQAPVRIGKHVIVGSGSVILPGVTINDISAVGALSVVNKDVLTGQVVGGTPAKFIKVRSTGLLNLEQQYLAHY